MAYLFLIVFIIAIIVVGGLLFFWLKKNKPVSDGGNLHITLVELITLFIIIGSVGLATATVFLSPPEKKEISLSAIAGERIDSLVAALTMYRFDILSIPSEEDGLEGLLVNKVGDSTWRGPYITSEEELIDPWGRPYKYWLVDGRYEILSLGADNKVGGSGENRDLSRQE